MNEEEWKTIEGYPDYWVSDRGQVKSLKYGKSRILKPWLNGDGYLFVVLCRDGKQKKFSVHRLVALAFCDGYEDGFEVDHINGKKTDNRAENLRWVCKSINNVNQQKARSQTGYVGVYWRPGNLAKPYQALAKVAGKLKHLGYFATAEDASAARDEFVRSRFLGEELMFHHREEEE